MYIHELKQHIPITSKSYALHASACPLLRHKATRVCRIFLPWQCFIVQAILLQAMDSQSRVWFFIKNAGGQRPNGELSTAEYTSRLISDRSQLWVDVKFHEQTPASDCYGKKRKYFFVDEEEQSYRVEDCMDWSMVRAFDGGNAGVVQALPGQLWVVLEQNSISPTWSPRFFAWIILIRVQIKLICGGESNGMLQITSQYVFVHHFLQLTITISIYKTGIYSTMRSNTTGWIWPDEVDPNPANTPCRSEQLRRKQLYTLLLHDNSSRP